MFWISTFWTHSPVIIGHAFKAHPVDGHAEEHSQITGNISHKTPYGLCRDLFHCFDILCGKFQCDNSGSMKERHKLELHGGGFNFPIIIESTINRNEVSDPWSILTMLHNQNNCMAACSHDYLNREMSSVLKDAALNSIEFQGTFCWDKGHLKSDTLVLELTTSLTRHFCTFVECLAVVIAHKGDGSVIAFITIVCGHTAVFWESTKKKYWRWLLNI